MKSNITQTPEYWAWRSMKRNHRPLVYPDWLNKNGFDLFLKSVGRKPWKKSVLGGWCLTRIDFNIGFVPGNCKWEPRGVHASRFRRWVNALELPA